MGVTCPLLLKSIDDGYRTDRYPYLSAEQIRKEAAAIVHYDQIDPRHHLEQFAEDMDRPPKTR